MFIAIDVQYNGDEASIAGVIFESWDSQNPLRVAVSQHKIFGEYEPGYFYKRELPCIMSLLDSIPETFKTIVIDGYVTLGQDNRPGLGAHLFDSIGNATPVIGVGKTKFHGISSECEILRGTSVKPLYITSIGKDLIEAKINIKNMHGNYRIPTMLKLADYYARNGANKCDTSDKIQSDF